MSDDRKPHGPATPDEPDHDLNDEVISRLYKKLPALRPHAATDAEILAIARGVVDAGRSRRWMAWGGGLAAAAAVVLAVGLYWLPGSRPAQNPLVASAPAPVVQPPPTVAAAPAAAVASAAPSIEAAPAASATNESAARLADNAAPTASAAPTPAAPPAKIAMADNALAMKKESREKEESKARLALNGDHTDAAAAHHALSAPMLAAAPERRAAAPAPAYMERSDTAAVIEAAPAAAKPVAKAGSGAWSRLDHDLQALRGNREAELQCRNDGEDAVANDACALLQNLRAGKRPNPEDVKALGHAIKRYAPDHKAWFGSLQELLQQP